MEINALATPAAERGAGSCRAVVRGDVPRTRRYGFVFLLAAALAGGAALRLENVGRFGFWTDELFQVLAAKSLLSDGSLYVPTVGRYDRAVPVTYLTAASFRLFGESEAAARVPFVLIHMLFILAATLALKKLFSARTALVFVFVMCFSPFAIRLARECRMYAPFQFAFFFTALAFFLGFEDARPRSARSGPWAALEAKHEINVLRLAVSAVLFVAALSLHELAFNFAFVVGGYAAVMLLRQWAVGGAREAAVSKYAVVLGLCAAGFLYLLAFESKFLAGLWAVARGVPDWAPYKATDHHFYRYFLADEYPALFYAYPLGACLLIRQYGKKGVFMVTAFVGLFLLHSFVFGRKGDRYIFYIFPFFIAAPAALFAALLPAAAAAAARAVPSAGAGRIARAGLLLAMAYGLGQPWLEKARFEPETWHHIDWKSFPGASVEKAKAGPVMTTDPRAFFYYHGRMPDFYFVEEKSPRYAYEPGLVASPEQLHAILDGNPGLSFVTTEWRLSNRDFVDPELRDIILRRMRVRERLPDGRTVVLETPEPESPILTADSRAG
ncbi:MAG: glycosyltransferase family 39 protein [Elusimicrobiota bacterium]